MDYKWVASAIQFSRRRENVAFSIHAEVAALPRAEQDEMLKRAEAEGWTRADARKKLGKGPHVAENSDAERKLGAILAEAPKNEGGRPPEQTGANSVPVEGAPCGVGGA